MFITCQVCFPWLGNTCMIWGVFGVQMKRGFVMFCMDMWGPKLVSIHKYRESCVGLDDVVLSIPHRLRLKELK